MMRVLTGLEAHAARLGSHQAACLHVLAAYGGSLLAIYQVCRHQERHRLHDPHNAVKSVQRERQEALSRTDFDQVPWGSLTLAGIRRLCKLMLPLHQ